jgi:uncharacterized membrane-anchored protein YjiN (DUF445 family)
MKQIATGLLVAAAVVFLIATWFANHSANHFWDFLQAAAEGAMVGALADWFAVTALFRHPLGIPIPHTAIVATRKAEIGERLGDFIQKHFLRYRIVLSKLRTHRPARKLLEWCGTETGAEQCVNYLAQLATWALKTTEERPIADFLQTHLIRPLARLEVAPIVATILELLTKEGHHRELADHALNAAPGLLERLKPKLRAIIDQEIPWYAGFLRGMAYQKIVNQLQSALEEIRANPEHPARLRAEEGLAQYITKLRADPATQEKVQWYWIEVLGNKHIADYAQHVAVELRELLLAQAADPQSPLRLAVRGWIVNAAKVIARDETLLATLERNIERGALNIVRLYRAQFAKLISEEVARWPTESATRLIEENIGADLQWIRINGTLVGGLAGLVIHTVAVVL